MTYLETVNKVLTRLREDNVITVNQNSYSSLIGEFVNDAKKIVEDAWDWSALRSTITVTAFADDYTHSLVGLKDSGEILSGINDTANAQLKYREQTWFEDQLYLKDTVSAAPVYYTYNGFDGNNDTQILIYPIPDKTYSLRFKTIVRGVELSEDTDVLKVPSTPVVHLAVALASRERGETGGTSAAELFSIADRSLSDAIAIDAARHPEELIYRAV